MMLRLGAEGFIGELCNGFRLLMDGERGVITFESLKRNSILLGLNDMRDDEIVCMLSEGDLDGDGALNQVLVGSHYPRLSAELLILRWPKSSTNGSDGNRVRDMRLRDEHSSVLAALQPLRMAHAPPLVVSSIARISCLLPSSMLCVCLRGCF
ncbi:hypothetical protein PTKIN_Ptkin14bG0095100 [Pterospermum kingtungense]